jgi:hypothetical protein
MIKANFLSEVVPCQYGSVPVELTFHINKAWDGMRAKNRPFLN